jgi:putative selenate reductase
MSDHFRPVAFERLASWIFGELEGNSSILGIPSELFFVPDPAQPYATEFCGHAVETPVGVAAGPHSQLAPNIVAAWLCGARVVELKTVQTLEQIEVSKPCIDMEDAGYNVEWSQELGLEQSLDEYLNAFVLTHVLHRRLGFPGDSPGVVFNLSVGYDLDGIRRPNMSSFLERVSDCGQDIAARLEILAHHWPEARNTAVPSRLSDNVTLSTMHGCPAAEIGDIAGHLMESWRLHTSIKLNPTLLGPQAVRRLLSDRLGYREISVPDAAFEHYLRFDQALSLIRGLAGRARDLGVEFSLKLANTLEVSNHREVFDSELTTMYLSGRPLHALVVELAHRLTEALDGAVRISFAGGADAFNVAELLAAGLRPVTACSDLLRPPGYLRLPQYLSEIERAMDQVAARSLDDFVLRRAGDLEPGSDPQRLASAARTNLERYARQVADRPELARDRFDRTRTKTERYLGSFDCIEAPCIESCAVGQRVPEYMRLVRDRRFGDAVAVTRDDNPLAAILGRACHHPCERPCSRSHLDDPLAIREIKRFIMEHELPSPEVEVGPNTAIRVAIVGAGPCGLSAASFLVRAGARATVFEARPASGGMVSATIPGYRADQRVIDQDLARLTELGVEIRHGTRIGADVGLQSLRDQGFDHIVVAGGAQLGVPLGIPGEDSSGVWDGLDFLRAARSKSLPPPGDRIAVIGGGDAAMDCARTARRLGANEVMVLYRRSADEMPAQAEELRGLIEEGVVLHELVSPREAIAERGQLVALRCVRNRLGDPDDSGRPRPVEISGSEFSLPLDALVVAIGQRADLGLFADLPVAINASGYLEVDPHTLETSVPGVYAGGDMIGDGPATIVKACGDGRRIASAILRDAGIAPQAEDASRPVISRDRLVELLRTRSHRRYRVDVPELPPTEREDFEEVVKTVSPRSAAAEAERCLDCDLLCSNCEWVCPNRAFVTYRVDPTAFHLMRPDARGVDIGDDSRQLFVVGQNLQVAVLAGLCNECGNCTTFCPTAGAPYRDKPRLYLNRGEFEAQSDNAFMLATHGARLIAQGRFEGALHELVVAPDCLYYATGDLRLELDARSLKPIHAAALTNEGDGTSLHQCATMWALACGITNSLPWLPTTPVEELALLQPDRV